MRSELTQKIVVIRYTFKFIPWLKILKYLHMHTIDVFTALIVQVKHHTVKFFD